mgnify:FL=1
MSRQSELAQLGRVFDTGPLSNRNLIINGAMQVAQRGTSKTGIVSSSTSFPTCDRVKFWNAGGAGPTYTVTQATDAPDGFKYSWKIETTTADSSIPAAHYSLLRLGLIEYQDTRGLAYGTSSAKKTTLSFWVKSSIAGDQDFVLASHGSIQRHHGQTLTINSANTWEYKTFVFDGDTDTTNTPDSELDNKMHLTIDFRITAGSDYQGGTLPSSWGARSNDETSNNSLQIGSTLNATFQITGVQLEVGDTATPFEHRSYADELARCRRYLYRINGNSDDQTAIAPGYFYGTTTLRVCIQFPVEMRTTPTASADNSYLDVLRDATNDTSVTLGSTLDESPYSTNINITGVASTTIGEGGILRLSNNTSAYIQFDAEL